MKPKNKHAKLKRKKEFRFHDVFVKTNDNELVKIRHPAYIFLQKGNIYIYVTLTHSDSIEKILLIKLRKNPNPQDTSDSYRIALSKLKKI